MARSLVPMLLALASLVVLGVPARALRVRSLDHEIAAERYQGDVIIPPPAWLRVMSLGHREALADLFWLRALVYYGDEIRNRGEFAHVFEYIDAMVALDPDFREPYLWAGTAALYHTRAVSADEVRRSVRILERAAERWPEDSKIAWELGATISYELVPLLEDPEEKERARLLGTEHLAAAARLGAGPSWAVFANAATLRRLGRTEQAIRHLEEMYSIVREPEIREEIERQIAALRGQAEAEALRESVRQFEEQRRAEYPYLDDGLYLHVGPRFPERLDWRRMEEE